MENENKFFYQKVKGMDFMVKRAMLEYHETINGFESIVVFDRGGYRCGYIGIDADIPEFEEIKNDIGLIETHGNLYCFYNEDFSEAIGSDKNLYWIGYDCNHDYDRKDFDTVEKYFGRNIREAQEGINGYFYGYESGTHVSLEECKAINLKMLKQLDGMFFYEFDKTYKEIIGKEKDCKNQKVSREQ